MNKRLKLDKTGHNQRYQQNNRKIQKAFIILNKAHRWHTTLRQIIDRTKLTKRTLYAHYPDIDNALVTIEQEIIDDFKTTLRQKRISLAKIMPDNNRLLFFVVMLYMSENKDLFIPICKDIANHTVLYRIIEIIYPMLEITWFPTSSPAPCIGEERADMYVRMCVEILNKWGRKTSCDFKKSEKYLRKLVRLTGEASLRCR